MPPGEGRSDAPARRALQEPLLDEVGFDDVLERLPVLSDRRRKVVNADGAA